MSAHELAPRLPRTARLLSHQWAALAVVLTGTFMVVLDFFIVNVALPSIATDLHASESSLEWVVAGYGSRSLSPDAQRPTGNRAPR